MGSPSPAPGSPMLWQPYAAPHPDGIAAAAAQAEAEAAAAAAATGSAPGSPSAARTRLLQLMAAQQRLQQSRQLLVAALQRQASQASHSFEPHPLDAGAAHPAPKRRRTAGGEGSPFAPDGRGSRGGSPAAAARRGSAAASRHPLAVARAEDGAQGGTASGNLDALAAVAEMFG